MSPKRLNKKSRTHYEVKISTTISPWKYDYLQTSFHQRLTIRSRCDTSMFFKRSVKGRF